MLVNCTSRAGGGFSTRLSPRAIRRPIWLCDVLSGNGDESTSHIQMGRPALISHGRHSLAALAVVGRPALLPSGHGAGMVLVPLRRASSVPAAVALVARLGAPVPAPHWLVLRRPSHRAAGVRRVAACAGLQASHRRPSAGFSPLQPGFANRHQTSVAERHECRRFTQSRTLE